MISFLLMSLVSWAPCDAPRSVTFEAANVASLRVEALARLDALNDPLASTLEVLRPEMARGDETASTMSQADPNGGMVQTGGPNGCVRTGAVVKTVTVGPMNPVPSCTEGVTPYTCPNGIMVQRFVKHCVWSSDVTVTWSYEQVSTVPGGTCSPDVQVQHSTETTKESWTYTNNPGCPGSCCEVASSESVREYSGPLVAGLPSVAKESIKCPDGSKGEKTTTTQHFFRLTRWVTTQTYVSNCPGVDCPPTTNVGPWAWVEFQQTVTVTTNCGATPI